MAGSCAVSPAGRFFLPRRQAHWAAASAKAFYLSENFSSRRFCRGGEKRLRKHDLRLRLCHFLLCAGSPLDILGGNLGSRAGRLFGAVFSDAPAVSRSMQLYFSLSLCRLGGNLYSLSNSGRAGRQRAAPPKLLFGKSGAGFSGRMSGSGSELLHILMSVYISLHIPRSVIRSILYSFNNKLQFVHAVFTCLAEFALPSMAAPEITAVERPLGSPSSSSSCYQRAVKIQAACSYSQRN